VQDCCLVAGYIQYTDAYSLFLSQDIDGASLTSVFASGGDWKVCSTNTQFVPTEWQRLR
jgi:hypothetical protein